MKRSIFAPALALAVMVGCSEGPNAPAFDADVKASFTHVNPNTTHETVIGEFDTQIEVIVNVHPQGLGSCVGTTWHSPGGDQETGSPHCQSQLSTVTATFSQGADYNVPGVSNNYTLTFGNGAYLSLTGVNFTRSGTTPAANTFIKGTTTLIGTTTVDLTQYTSTPLTPCTEGTCIVQAGVNVSFTPSGGSAKQEALDLFYF
jgi:hypothetical protein